MTLVVACSGGSDDTTDSETMSASGVSIDPTIDPSAGSSSSTADDDDDDDDNMTTTDTTAGGATPCGSDEDCADAPEGPHCCGPDKAGSCFNGEGFCWTDPDICGEYDAQTPVLVPPNVMLVLDKSGSMFNQDNFWDHDLDDMDDDGFNDLDPMMAATPKQSRWKSLHGVVTQIVSTFNDSMHLGAQLFPSKDGVAVLGPQACVVNDQPEAAVAPNNAMTILNVIPPAGDLSGAGGTPAEKGITSAVNHLNGIELAENQENYVILITDGAANCSVSAMDDAALLDYDENLVPTIAAAAAQPGETSIKTYVVGVDIKDEVDANNINPFQVLNDAALAGGVPKDDPVEKFYNATNQIELQEALDGIIGQVLDCTIPIEGGVPPNTKPVLEIDGMTYEDPIDIADCGSMDGWAFVDDSMMEIELCGALCSAYQVLGTINMTFKCTIQG